MRIANSLLQVLIAIQQQIKSNEIHRLCLHYHCTSKKMQDDEDDEDTLKSTCLQFFIIRCFVKTSLSESLARKVRDVKRKKNIITDYQRLTVSSLCVYV